jgi:glyoxylase-like metal-dependent hydrolase (beta-lactamase superfamily II)
MPDTPIYPHEALEFGDTLEVAPGIVWLRMPLPFALNHINLWLLEDDDGWTVVDTGFHTPEARNHWEAAVARFAGAAGIDRMIVTHFHPDHIGLAGWFEERWGTQLWMTYTEWLQAQLRNADTTDEFAKRQVAFWRANGLDPERGAAYRASRSSFAAEVTPTPTALRRIDAGEEIAIGGRRWRVITGEGHSPEHAALYCAETNVLISGDQVLPRISPVVSLWSNEPEGNPLRRFLRSLDKFRPLPADVFVLPSHDRPFRGLHERLDSLAAHHDARLNAALDAVAEPRTAFEVVPHLFKRELGPSQIAFAMGESLSHLNYLVEDGKAERWRDRDGIVRFRRTA